MNKRVVVAGLSLLLCVALAGCTVKTDCKAYENSSNSVNAGAKTVIDAADKDGLPQNFRISDARYIQKSREKRGKTVNLRGLDSLSISGSAQFSQKELAAIKKAIGKGNIVIIDLRQESHGFVNGNAVSLMGVDNKVNKGQSDAESEKNQNRFLSSFKIGSKLSISGQKAFTVQSVSSEAQLVKSAGMKYQRQPATDREKPTDRTVDEFLKTLKALPQNSRLHFHCKAGQGRATTFMCMVDMMHNAKYVSFDDIIYRQYLIGGLDLTDKSTGEDVKGRLNFLKSFYRYCKEDSDNFKTAYGEWEMPTRQ